jgi:hypothetical protein
VLIIGDLSGSKLTARARETCVEPNGNIGDCNSQGEAMPNPVTAGVGDALEEIVRKLISRKQGCETIPLAVWKRAFGRVSC